MADTVSPAPREGQTATATAGAIGALAGAGARGRGRKQASLWGDAWRRLRQNKLAISGLVVAILLSLIAIFAPLIAREDLFVQNYDALYAHPSALYPMGTDQLGRDILSRVIWGSRVSLLVGLVAQLIVLAIGVPVGALAGYFGGKTDLLLMRIVDVMYAFPQLLFVILLMSMWGRGLGNIFIAIGLTGWVTLARLVRAQFLSLREKDYVIAAQSIGARFPPDRQAYAAEYADPDHRRADLRYSHRNLHRVLPELHRCRHRAATDELGPDGRRESAIPPLLSLDADLAVARPRPHDALLHLPG